MVDDGALKVAEGRLPDADLIIHADRGRVLLDVIGGQTSAAEAVRTGRLAIDGRLADLELFASLFRLTAAPSPQEGIVVH
jgi:putative sterol carrier protein